MSSIKERVDAKIAGKKVMVFSKTYCPYCTKAKKAFEDYFGKNQDDYEVMEIENDKDCSGIQDYLNQLTGGRSVPRVFINGKFIGGGDDVVAKKRSGELVKLLE